MKKLPIELLKNYTKRLNEHELKTLGVLLQDRLFGDLPAALHIMQRHIDMDRWLGSARDVDEFYEMLDFVEDYIVGECKRRYELIRT